MRRKPVLAGRAGAVASTIDGSFAVELVRDTAGEACRAISCHEQCFSMEVTGITVVLLTDLFGTEECQAFVLRFLGSQVLGQWIMTYPMLPKEPLID